MWVPSSPPNPLGCRINGSGNPPYSVVSYSSPGRVASVILSLRRGDLTLGDGRISGLDPGQNSVEGCERSWRNMGSGTPNACSSCIELGITLKHEQAAFQQLPRITGLNMDGQSMMVGWLPIHVRSRRWAQILSLVCEATSG
ncbi:MAG: hypothetical protein QOE04_1302 [Mycobacterium sp.]|nr:hypothetical protein [Mycobacterium sp.]